MLFWESPYLFRVCYICWPKKPEAETKNQLSGLISLKAQFGLLFQNTSTSLVHVEC
jgi:hypothetical protein